MKSLSAGALAVAVIGLAILTLMAIGAPGSRPSGDIRPTALEAPAGPAVTSGGVTLTSVAEEWPTDAATFPDGPNVALVNASCTSCHSASMVLTQPPLSPEQWAAVVKKMIDVYKAPVAERDVPAIVGYLSATAGPKPVVPSPDTEKSPPAAR